MRTIHGRAKKSNARPVLEFDLYLDTTILSFPRARLPRADWQALVDLYGVVPHHYSNRTKGYLLVGFQCPQPDLLRKLTRVSYEHDGQIYRLDIGCDARRDEDLTVEEQFNWLKDHMLLRHRPAQPIEEIENGTDRPKGFYFCPHAHINGAPRDICLYWDKDSKLDPDPENIATHFDLRLRGKPAKKYWIGELEEFDPAQALLEHIRFVNFDRIVSERTMFRKMTEGKSPMEARRLIANAKRYGQIDFVQRLHDQRMIRLRENRGLVSLPHVLTWGAKRRSFKDQGISKEINLLGTGIAKQEDT